MRLWKFMVVCSAALVAVFATPGGVCGEEALDEGGRALWERHWGSYAKQCAEFEGGFLVCPLYNRRYPSGAGITVRQAQAKLSRKVRVGGGGVVVTRTLKRPVEEAQAMALPIPKLRVGEYGTLASAQVREVLGETSMLVEKVYLIDPVQVRKDYRADRKKLRDAEDVDDADEQLEKRYEQREAVLARHKDRRHRSAKLRLEGFSTMGLEEGDRWSGPDDEGFKVVIAGRESYGSERRPHKRLVAVWVDEVKWGLDEDAFVRLLGERGMDRAGFVEVIQKRMGEKDPRAARAHVFHAILTGKAPVTTEPEEAKEDVGGDDPKDGS